MLLKIPSTKKPQQNTYLTKETKTTFANAFQILIIQISRASFQYQLNDAAIEPTKFDPL